MDNISKVITSLFTSSLGDGDIESQKNFFLYCKGVTFPNALILSYSKDLCKNIGVSKDSVYSSEFINIVTGNEVPQDIKPYALRYGGHQFGYWAGQLGDGRVLNLGEIQKQKNIYTLQIKGSGPNGFSRGGDGFAVLRSSVREYVCSEAMHHLGIPTTRALCLLSTGDTVIRDVMYDGNPILEPGALVCRIAPSFIRFGSFEILAKENKLLDLKKLIDFIIEHYYPYISLENKNRYVLFLQEVSDKTLDMIIHWQRVGFVHGVMNTDNMSILGVTLDYGPYGFLDIYDANWTPNTTDSEGRRYRFGNQANIALCNIVQLANALHPLIQDIPAIEKIVEKYRKNYQKRYYAMMRQKLGLKEDFGADILLIEELIKLLQTSEIDYTIFFRNLSTYEKNKTYTEDILEPIKDAFYNTENVQGVKKIGWENWIHTYLRRLSQETQSDIERKSSMNQVNPKYIWRNYIASQVIEDVEKGDTKSLEACMKMLEKPYDEQPEFEKYFTKRPDWAKEKVGCSMLSCSS